MENEVIYSSNEERNLSNREIYEEAYKRLKNKNELLVFMEGAIWMRNKIENPLPINNPNQVKLEI